MKTAQSLSARKLAILICFLAIMANPVSGTSEAKTCSIDGAPFLTVTQVSSPDKIILPFDLDFKYLGPEILSITYTVTIKNIGSDCATNVRLVDDSFLSLPAVTITSALIDSSKTSHSRKCDISFSNHKLDCSLGDLGSGESVIVQISVDTAFSQLGVVRALYNFVSLSHDQSGQFTNVQTTSFFISGGSGQAFDFCGTFPGLSSCPSGGSALFNGEIKGFLTLSGIPAGTPVTFSTTEPFSLCNSSCSTTSTYQSSVSTTANDFSQVSVGLKYARNLDLPFTPLDATKILVMRDLTVAFDTVAYSKMIGAVDVISLFPAPNTAPNAPPVADDQNVTTGSDPTDIVLTGSDPEGVPVTFTVVTQPVNGVLDGNAPDLVYVPAANYSGSDSFTFKVNDGIANSNVATVSLTVNPGPPTPLAITVPSLAPGEVGLSYRASLGITGGVPPYSVSLTSGALPAGLTPGEIITGTPTISTTKSFTLAVRDATGARVNKSYSIQTFAKLAISTTSLSSGRVGRSYSATLKAAGGQTPRTWSIISGVMPDGVVFNGATGAITGIPSLAGSVNLTFRVIDPLGAAAQKTLTLTITN
jgi:hypothetical protein